MKALKIFAFVVCLFSVVISAIGFYILSENGAMQHGYGFLLLLIVAIQPVCLLLTIIPLAIKIDTDVLIYQSRL